MTVIAAYLYRDGKREREIPIDGKVECATDKSEFVWIGIANPDEEEMRTLQEAYDLHPLAVEDALKADQLPKVDIYGDQLFVVARTAHLEGDRIEYGETAVFVGHSHIISVRHGSPRAHAELRGNLERAPTLLKHGVDYVLHAILDFITEGYLPMVEQLEEEVLAMERHAIDSFLNREEIGRIFTLRRELMRFQRVLGPMAEVAGKFVRIDLPCIDPEAKPYFSDVLDHVRRVQAMVDDLREVLTSVFEFSSLLEGQRVGVVTRQLAAWAAILAVPTAVAGIYGMNFEHMPELKWVWGYPVTIVAIVTVCSWLYLRFKKFGWL
jgi:magnesium transporter